MPEPEREQREAEIAGKWAAASPHLSERARRVWLGAEARELGYGGIRFVSQATGAAIEFNFGLWTRRRVRELIRRKFGIDYTEQNVGKILKLLGFSPQRPVYQAVQQNEGKRREWTEKTFPRHSASGVM